MRTSTKQVLPVLLIADNWKYNVEVGPTNFVRYRNVRDHSILILLVYDVTLDLLVTGRAYSFS